MAGFELTADTSLGGVLDLWTKGRKRAGNYRHLATPTDTTRPQK
jgi:hypothetical protein